MAAAAEATVIVRRVPETRVERIIFALGVCTIAAIAALIVLDGGEAPASPPPVTVAAVRPAPKTVTRRPTGIPEPQPRPRRPHGVTLQLSAARSDSWVELRSSSAQGDVLFTGLINLGETRSFRAPRLYARFGNASALDARLNGKLLGLQPGTYSALVTPRGLADVTPR